MIRMHPEADLLVEYASGSLSLAPTISVTAHLQFCETCSHAVESLKDIGGALLATTLSMPISGDLLDSVLKCIEEEGDKPLPARSRRPHQDDVARTLPRFVQDILPAQELDWRKQTSSVRVAAISVGEQRHELALHRINAGGKAPAHDHRGREITVVLKGSFSDEDGVYQPGDFIVREPGEQHRPFAARNEECICLSVLEAPIRLTGIKRIFNPFLSFSPS